MSHSSTEFHKIWIEQCAATEDIRGRFGTKNALDYLIGFAFVEAAEQDSEFAQELPAFVAAIQRLFSASEIRAYLDHLERTKFLAPPNRRPRWRTRRKRWTTNLGRPIPSWVPRNCCASPAFGSCSNPSAKRGKA